MQRDRFMHEQQLRQTQGLPVMEIDQYLLSALQQGVPSCSGVALGVDRLCAIAFAETSIANTLAFDWSRA